MRPPRPSSPARFDPKHTLLAFLGLAGATLAVYAGTFSAPFVFDDVPSIIDNPSLRPGQPWWSAFVPPAELNGMPVGGRPLVNASLALNYALGGVAPAGYHVVNLLLHLLAGLALFGIVRRTLARAGNAWASSATPLALSAAALWCLHPLQTESVTYTCQRAESLMALCTLVTLYAFVRSLDSPRSGRWLALSVFACLLGMACKEVMVAAPVLVLLYDRTFVAGSFAAAWRARQRYYLTLAATWLLLAVLVYGNRHRGGTAGFETGITPWTYALTQVYAVPHYLRLALWPEPLVFDYGIMTITDFAALALPALALAAALAATIYALVRHPALGFLGAWVFIILAPTSSVVPIATQTMAAHRAYLPLAALCVLAVLAMYRLAGRKAFVGYLALAVALSAATFRRNQDYRSALVLWTDTVQKVPANDRAHGNLAILLAESGRIPEAIEQFNTALRLRPDFPEARANLAGVYLQLGRPQEAAGLLVEALRLKPDLASARCNLGVALKQLGRRDAAATQFRETVRAHPDYPYGHHNLAICLLEDNALPDAIAEFEIALRLLPNYADAHANISTAYLRAGQLDRARSHAEAALRLKPGAAPLEENLALIQARIKAAAAK